MKVSTYLNFNGNTEEAFNFYKTVFGFRELRYFDIRGVKTGLTWETIGGTLEDRVKAALRSLLRE